MRRNRDRPFVVSSDPQMDTARRRVSRLSTNELLNWADVASAGLMRGFEDYRGKGDKRSLDEIRVTLISLTALTDELIIRHEVEQEQ